MKGKTLKLTCPEQDVEAIDKAAEEHGLSRSRYLLECARGGRGGVRNPREGAALARQLNRVEAMLAELFEVLRKTDPAQTRLITRLALRHLEQIVRWLVVEAGGTGEAER